MTSNFRLVVRSGPSAGETYDLEKSEIFIGRDTNNDVVINDSEVSRRHARLYMQGGNYVIEDLGSTNGTSVNGQRIVGPYVLRPGELIMLGEHITLLFESTQPAQDATVASSRQPATERAPSPPPQQPRPYSPPPPAPSYSGQVPQQPEPPSEGRKLPTWGIAAIIAVVLLLCICLLGLYIIDANAMWCDWFGFIFNMMNPGTCP